MFTGLIEEMGTVVERVPSGDGERIRIDCHTVLGDTSHGDSIAVSGVCLTAIDIDATGFYADVMAETLRQSTASTWRSGQRVNLERAASLGDRLGGHIVQGHVDGRAQIISVTPGQQWSVVRFELTPEVSPLVVRKGSIALDGVSLTVSAVGEGWAEVSLIPETLHSTTLGNLREGDVVNVETDILARHVQRLMETTQLEEAR